MTKQYLQDYETLGLDERADWDAVCNAYRAGLKRWDPAGFVRPRERVHAEQRLTHVVQAYHRLRTYYREHDRLPLAPTLRGRAGGAVTAVGSRLGRRGATRRRAGKRAVRPAAAQRPDTDDFPSPPLKTPTRRASTWRQRMERLPWYLVAGAALLATLAFVVALDSSERRADRDESDRNRLPAAESGGETGAR